jgi:hypothetical protein
MHQTDLLLILVPFDLYNKGENSANKKRQNSVREVPQCGKHNGSIHGNQNNLQGMWNGPTCQTSSNCQGMWTQAVRTPTTCSAYLCWEALLSQTSEFDVHSPSKGRERWFENWSFIRSFWYLRTALWSQCYSGRCEKPMGKSLRSPCPSCINKI